MANQQPIRIKTISGYHELMQLPKPAHPLVSVTRFEDVKLTYDEPVSRIMDFYSIAIKRNTHVKMKYGQQEYDFNEGIMFCMSPGQLLRIEIDKTRQPEHTGWNLLIHPDFLWNTPLAKTIKKYEFFDYSVNEALFLSSKEEDTLVGIMQQIDQECQSNVDKFSQDIIIAQLELLLTYTERFYHRQFITRKINNHKVLDRLEQVLSEYFNSEDITKYGLPTVTYIAEKINISPNYLSGLLKVLTGQSTQQHIHEELIKRAKEKLSTTALSVSEIAYELGFEHPQSFSKLFKTKTKLSPVEFRQAFSS
ncbi:helix-turn-helix transcriptional regulator [Chitinophaga polysaccharea]|uniref:helix-turn-helix domain-containing protein n=1 Tax=Chitinophaga TaxID=79328 RepID=UPI0014555BF5|nr:MULTISPECIES: helix-turn-helix transcriptional regulator [Chitinophaga]NLR61772.1 helix-turn-helix transcriptional regulator [Chitinophaga polysaccharea]NLU92630.1 helix-turn-helix transcriptional regulator [Chitinophaga sp. Ak27]